MVEDVLFTYVPSAFTPNGDGFNDDWGMTKNMDAIRDFQLQQSYFADDDNSLKSLNLSDVEREVIKQAVRKSNGNLTKAAEELGIGRTTLYRKMEEYGINPEA